MGLIVSLKALLQIFSGVFVIGFASTAGLLYRYQRVLIYPASFPAGSRTEVARPSEFQIPFDEVWLDAPEGVKLHLYAMVQRTASQKEIARGEDKDGDATAKRRPTVLFLHANAGNMGHRLPIAQVFYRRFGCNVVMLSYRGYGLSTGSPSEAGIRADAQLALDWIRSHPILGGTALIAYGQSLGGAVAVDLAARNHKDVQALILENTFISIPALIPHVLPPIRPFTFLCREYWHTGDSIQRVPSSTPVLFMSGRKDELVPPRHMDYLFRRCGSEHKVWKAIEDGTHNDTCIKAGYFEAISSFIKHHVAPLAASGNFYRSIHSIASRDTPTASALNSSPSADVRRRPRAASQSGSGSNLASNDPSQPFGKSRTVGDATKAASISGTDEESEWVQMSEREAEEAKGAIGSAPKKEL